MPDSATVLHLDLDCFFVSVERLHDPALVGRPVLVGGRPEARGVVASASYESRRYGCRSAMPMAQALRLCPDAIVVPGRQALYSEYSRRVMAILGEVTPLVEQVSVDEAFLDVAGCEMAFGPPEQIARVLKQRIADEQGLPSSLGLAANKLLAKIASGDAKPEGILRVPPGSEAAYLAPRPVRDLPGIGPQSALRLQQFGISTIGELARLEEATLVRTFGRKHGASLYRKARGQDEGRVDPEQRRKSISHENTFATDIANRSRLERELLTQAERVATRLRKGGVHGRTVTLKLRYDDFSTITRSVTLERPTALATPIFEAATTLLRGTWRRGRKVRLIGVGVSNLAPPAGYQLGLFDPEPNPRDAAIARTLDSLRERFGEDVVTRARLIDPASDGEDATG